MHKYNNSHIFSARISSILLPVAFALALIASILVSSLSFILPTNAQDSPQTGITKIGRIGGYDSPPLAYPHGVALDAAGNIYVADTDNDRIQKFDSAGQYQMQFGTQGSGDGQFDDPRGVALDTAGNIYVADTQNNRIQKFNSDGQYQMQLGSYGSGDGQFNYPSGVALDTAGNIYVADRSNNRIQKFNSDGQYQMQFGTQGSGDGQFYYPYGVALDVAGNIYVADTYNHRIQKFNSDGQYQMQFGTQGSGDGQFDTPRGVALDTAGNIYVADTQNNRIQKFNSDGQYQMQFGTQGSGDGQFDDPRGVALDAIGNIYVADTYNNRIQKFNSDGQHLQTIQSAGNPIYIFGSGINTDGNLVTSNLMGAINESGHDLGVKIYSPTGQQLSSWDLSDDSYIRYPYAAVEYVGEYYAAVYNANEGDGPSGSAIVRINAQGNIVDEWLLDNFGLGLAIDSTGVLYHLAGEEGPSMITKYSTSGEVLGSIDPSTIAGGIVVMPYGNGIAIDSQDNLYVADMAGSRAVKMSKNGDYITEYGSADAEGGSLLGTSSVSLATDGSVYIGDLDDQENLRVNKFSPQGEFLYRYESPAFGHAMTAGPNGRIYIANYQDYSIDILCDHALSLNNCAVDEGNPPVQPEALNTIPNKGDGKAIAMKAPEGSTLTSFVALPNADLPKDSSDVDYLYPLGLTSFILSNVSTGGTVKAEVFFETGLKPQDVTVRKYNPNAASSQGDSQGTPSSPYSTIQGATVTAHTLQGMTGLLVSYDITDGGPLDLDGLANGSITDPIGLAVEDKGMLANTGLLLGLTSAAGFLMITIAVYTYIDYRRHVKPLIAVDPHARYTYTYPHHIKTVTIPMFKYRVKFTLERA